MDKEMKELKAEILKRLKRSYETGQQDLRNAIANQDFTRERMARDLADHMQDMELLLSKLKFFKE